MKFRNIFFATILTSVTIPASALEITTELPGTLQKQIENPEEVSELSVSGPVDATDLFYIGLTLQNLTSLDLSNATISATFGTSAYGYTSYPEGLLPAGVFSGLPLTEFVFPETQPITIGESVFAQTAFTSVSLPDNVIVVGDGAFARCGDLTTVTMPNCKIGDAVFADCTALTTVNIGEVKAIPASTFRGCTALTKVNGSENVTAIGAQAFEGDTSLISFSFSPDITSIGNSAFAGTGLLILDLSEAEKIEEIGAQAFAETALSDVILPTTVTTISDGLFYGNTGITAIALPENTTSLGAHSLIGTRLNELVLPETLEEINEYALLGQDAIPTLTLPETLQYIGDNAMEGMTGLVEIDATALHHVPELGENVWQGVDQPSVKLIVDKDGDDTYVNMFNDAEQWQNFTVIGKSVGVDDVVTDSPNISAGIDVRGRFVGTDLQIESDGPVIDIVRVFDTNGRLLIAVEPADTIVTIDTADYPGGVFIINIVLDGKITATLKLARR